MSMPILTERLSIRPLEPRDAGPMFEYRSDPRVDLFQNWEPATVDAVGDLIAGQAEIGTDTPGRWYQLGLFERDSGSMAGDCGIHVQAHDPRQVEIGITLARASQGRGLATEALRAVLGHLFINLGRHRVYGSVDPRNTPSMALLERVGMRREAHHVESYWFKGAWADDVIFAMLRREYVAAQAELKADVRQGLRQLDRGESAPLQMETTKAKARQRRRQRTIQSEQRS